MRDERWERDTQRHTERERVRETQRERERERKRKKERERERNREREREMILENYAMYSKYLFRDLIGEYTLYKTTTSY